MLACNRALHCNLRDAYTKNSVPYPTNPLGKYVRLWKKGKSYYKKRSELTAEDKKLLPPPPVRNASEETLKKFKKENSDWKKRTGIK